MFAAVGNRIDHFGACGRQLHLCLEPDAARIEQVGEDRELVQVAVMHDAVVFVRLADGQHQCLYALERFLVFRAGAPHIDPDRLHHLLFCVFTQRNLVTRLFDAMPVAVQRREVVRQCESDIPVVRIRVLHDRL